MKMRIYIPEVSIEQHQLNKIINKENQEIFDVMFKVMEWDSDLKDDVEWKHLLSDGETRELSMTLNKYESIICELLNKYNQIVNDRLAGCGKTKLREALKNRLLYQINQIMGDRTPEYINTEQKI